MVTTLRTVFTMWLPVSFLVRVLFPGQSQKASVREAHLLGKRKIYKLTLNEHLLEV